MGNGHGNRILGRQDYQEPPPINSHECALIAQYRCVASREGFDKAHHWHKVYRGDVLVGFVATRMAGQVYRLVHEPPEDAKLAAIDWNRKDPLHAKAILSLIDLGNPPPPTDERKAALQAFAKMPDEICDFSIARE